MNLDPYQKKAACQDSMYSVIIAGAGTGKTYTLLGRIEYLMKEQKLKPEEILVISYTKETTIDFRKKAKEILGVDISVYTFHRFAMNLLEDMDYHFSLCTDYDMDYITHEFLFSYCKSNRHLKRYVLGIFSLFGKYGFKSFDKLIDQGALLELQKDLIHFIHLWRAKGKSLKESYEMILHSHGIFYSFFCLFYFLLHCYISEKESQKLLDFDDIIEVSTAKLANCKQFPYRHILVDEFQDSSFMRISFFRKLVDVFSLSFTVVGDDCQSIYHFSGTENNCFLLLKEFYPTLKTFYLKYTYRNSQELIDMANYFILKNPVQTKKEIISFKHVSNPIEILFYRNENRILRMLSYILKNKQNPEILFLGRYSFDWKYYFKENIITWLDQKHFTLKPFPNIVFTYLTVHQSKGLEAKTVVLLHVEHSVHGFPSQVKNNKFIKKISAKESFKHEEERKLFYVALTRTKGKIYCLVPLNRPSIFIKELLADFNTKIMTKYF